MSKKIIALMMALVMCLTLMTACGGKDTNTDEPTQTTENVATSDPVIESVKPDETTTPTTENTVPPTTENTETTAPDETEGTKPTDAPVTEPPHEHSYDKKTVNPTCDNKGYTVYTCECGDQYNADEKDALGHNYSNWETVKEPTTEETGRKERACTRCGKVDAAEIAKLQPPTEPVHAHSYSKKTVNATCDGKGYTVYTCECGDQYNADYTDALGHSYGDWVTVKEPTTEEAGRKERTCARCGHVDAAEIEKVAGSTEPEEESYPLRTEKTGMGTRYYRKNVSFTDSRKTWGDPPTVYGYDANSIYVSWYDKDGVLQELYIEPMDGYAVRYRLLDDGTVTKQYNALPN